MREIEINKENLTLFLKNLRKSDAEEMIYFFGKDYKNYFIDFLLKNKKETYFLSYKSIPSAIGGAYEDKECAQVWLLCAEKYDKKFLYKYIKEKFNQIKKKYDTLYNFIYKSNFKSINLLSKLGFEVIKTNNPDLKLFYITKGGNFDLRYFARQ